MRLDSDPSCVSPSKFRARNLGGTAFTLSILQAGFAKFNGVKFLPILPDRCAWASGRNHQSMFGHVASVLRLSSLPTRSSKTALRDGLFGASIVRNGMPTGLAKGIGRPTATIPAARMKNRAIIWRSLGRGKPASEIGSVASKKGRKRFLRTTPTLSSI
jgi:hypothetical protein